MWKLHSDEDCLWKRLLSLLSSHHEHTESKWQSVCQLPVFPDNCLNRGMPDTSRHEYTEQHGPFGDEHQLSYLLSYSNNENKPEMILPYNATMSGFR